MPELLPCLHRGFYAECENPACAMEPRTPRDYDTEQLAAAAWNERTPSPQPAYRHPQL